MSASAEAGGMDLALLVYPLGFVYSRHTLRHIPETYRRPFGDQNLYIHPQTAVAMSSGASTSVIFIGIGVDPQSPASSEQDIAAELRSRLEHSEAALVDYVSQIVGRFCVIYSSGSRTKVLTDAIGMRSVFYGVENDAVYIASHASLARRQIGAPPEPPTRPFRWGFPGLVTQFPQIFLLTPNTRLDLGSGKVERFFPLAPLSAVSAREAADYALLVGDSVLSALRKRWPIALSITSGIDSRVSLALSLPYARDITYFTYSSGGPFGDADVALARELAQKFGLRHLVLGEPGTKPTLSPEQQRQLVPIFQANCPYQHLRGIVPHYHRAFSSWRYLHIRSNMLEIGRASFQSKKKVRPDTPERATQFYISWVGTRLIPHREHILRCFRDYFAVTRWSDALAYIDPYDLYFWEHRMPAWHASVLLETDCVFDTVVLLNSRKVLERLVAVPVEARLDNAIYEAMIGARSPALLQYPFNPPTWPPADVAVAEPRSGPAAD